MKRLTRFVRWACGLLAVIVFSLSGLPASAQTFSQSGNLPVYDDVARFSHLDVDDGLSQSSITAILQDAVGFLWFGTEEGLNRYDGYRIKVYRNDPGDPASLGDNNILSLLEDSIGNLWIGTMGGGLDYFDRRTEKFTHYHSRVSASPGDDLTLKTTNTLSLGDDYVLALLMDAQGYLWIGTSGGLDRLDPRNGTFAHYLYYPEGGVPITALCQDDLGQLWVGTAFGVKRFDPHTGKISDSPTRLDEADSSPSLGELDVSALYADASENLWLGTQSGLVRFNPQSGEVLHYRYQIGMSDELGFDAVWSITQDAEGKLWVATSGGLNALDPISGEVVHYQHDDRDPYSLSNNNIRSVYIDHQKNLWVGTLGGGVNLLAQNETPFRHYRNLLYYPDSQTYNHITSIYEDGSGMLWLGTQGGLVSFNQQSGVSTHQRLGNYAAASSPISAIVPGAGDELWVGTRGSGLYRYNWRNGTYTRYQNDPANENSLGSNTITALIRDGSGILWIGTQTRGLDRFDPDSRIFTHYRYDPDIPSSLRSNRVWTVYEDPLGVLWVGTIRGLERFDRNTGRFQYFRQGSDLNGSDVISIYQDRTGTLWMGTFGEGLGRLDKDGQTITFYRVKDGLPSDVIYGILEDDQGRLWLSTNLGISRFNPQTISFKNYDVRDGLQGNEFNLGAFFQNSAGIMFFGGLNGVTFFDPASIRENPHLPPVVLTSLSQHGEPIKADRAIEYMDEFTIRWPNNYFDFEFAALNYTRPEKNLYAYKLENFDRDWNNIGTRRIGRYTNLPGGTYMLRLKAANNDGLWNEAESTIQVNVIPPVWQTWWFRGLALVLAVGAVALGVQIRVRGIQQRSLELEKQVRARTVEIERLFEKTKELAVVEERTRLARDLHDSAKQKAFAALAQLGAARTLVRSDVVRAGSVLKEAETLVYEVIEELTFLIQEMYPAALKERGLASALREYIYEWENRTEIHVDLHIHRECRLSLQIEQTLYRVVQESLANVARHSLASQVRLTVEYCPEVVYVTVADNGQGFDPSLRPCGVGITSMRERIRMINGTLVIDSQPGAGTRVTAEVPIRPANGLPEEGE